VTTESGAAKIRGERGFEVALGMGANLGDRLAALQRGIDVVCRDIAVQPIAVSPVYDSDPVGGPEQPDFLNAVLLIRTTLAPLEVLALGQLGERELARERSIRWGPRTLDIDVLSYGSVISDDKILTLPHPRAAERAFVLVPLNDVAPDLTLAGMSEPISRLVDLLSDRDRREVRVRTDLRLQLEDGSALDTL